MRTKLGEPNAIQIDAAHLQRPPHTNPGITPSFYLGCSNFLLKRRIEGLVINKWMRKKNSVALLPMSSLLPPTLHLSFILLSLSSFFFFLPSSFLSHLSSKFFLKAWRLKDEEILATHPSTGSNFNTHNFLFFQIPTFLSWLLIYFYCCR